MGFLRYHSDKHGVVLVLEGIMHMSEVGVRTEEALAGLLLHITNQVYYNILQVRYVAWGGPCMVALTFNDRHSTVVLARGFPRALFYLWGVWTSTAAIPQ